MNREEVRPRIARDTWDTAALMASTTNTSVRQWIQDAIREKAKHEILKLLYLRPDLVPDITAKISLADLTGHPSPSLVKDQ